MNKEVKKTKEGGDFNNPYDSLINFINRHRIDSKEEQRLREIIKRISAHEEQKELKALKEENERLKHKLLYTYTNYVTSWGLSYEDHIKAIDQFKSENNL